MAILQADCTRIFESGIKVSSSLLENMIRIINHFIFVERQLACEISLVVPVLATAGSLEDDNCESLNLAGTPTKDVGFDKGVTVEPLEYRW